MNAVRAIDDWFNGSILWIEERSAPDGTAVYEVIYEIESEPDMLRQVQIPHTQMYLGAKRGDAIMVSLSSKQIRLR